MVRVGTKYIETMPFEPTRAYGRHLIAVKHWRSVLEILHVEIQPWRRNLRFRPGEGMVNVILLREPSRDPGYVGAKFVGSFVEVAC